VLRAQGERNGAPSGAEPGGGRPHEELQSLAALATEIAGPVKRLARIRLARMRLRASRVAFLVLGGFALAVAATAAALAGVRLFVRGLTAGLGELADGRVWLAELWSGLLLLAGTAAVLVWIRSWLERRLVRDALGRGKERR
jgi:hypothetical protein